MKMDMIRTSGLAALLAMGACGHFGYNPQGKYTASLTQVVQPSYDDATTIGVKAGLDLDGNEEYENTVSLGADLDLTSKTAGVTLEYLAGTVLLEGTDNYLNGVISPQVRVDTSGQAEGSLRLGVQYEICRSGMWDQKFCLGRNKGFLQLMLGPGYQSSPAFDFANGRPVFDVTVGLGFIADY